MGNEVIRDQEQKGRIQVNQDERRKTQVNVGLDPENLAAVDKESGSRRVTRSALINAIVTAWREGGSVVVSPSKPAFQELPQTVELAKVEASELSREDSRHIAIVKEEWDSRPDDWKEKQYNYIIGKLGDLGRAAMGTFVAVKRVFAGSVQEEKQEAKPS